MSADPSNFERALELLTDVQDLRVWSLIVSLFGDLARAQGDQISSATISQIMAVIGIKPEAMRVALHRLRRDGWIESMRVGRTTHHQLTQSGWGQSKKARAPIYGAEPAFPEGWHILVGDGSDAAKAEMDELAKGGDYFTLHGSVTLAKGQAPNVENLLSVSGRAGLPKWLKQKLCPPEVIARYRNLDQRLAWILDAPPENLTAGQTAAFRTLVVHHWRRLALRNAHIPDELFEDDPIRSRCRVRVLELLDRYPRPSLSALEGA